MSGAMARLEEARGFRSAFYLLSRGRPTAREAGCRVRRYSVARPEIARAFRDLALRGWEVGLHVGYDAHEREGAIEDELERLRKALGHDVPIRGARSHYVRFHVPETWRRLAAAGLRYDTTMGWAQGWGPRAATFSPFRPFDRQSGQVLPLWELGMHMMDVAQGGLDDMLRVTERGLASAAEHQGCLCLLVHPHPCFEAGRGEFLWAYESLLGAVASRADAWVTTPAAVVEWLEERSRLD
jgi:hypothetical protein